MSDLLPARMAILRLSLAVLCALLLTLASLAPSARAEASHTFLSSLTGAEPSPSPPVPPFWNYSPDHSFEDPCGVAVDSYGDIYIADHSHHVVDVYDSSSRYLTQVHADGPCDLAVASDGVLYVNNWHRNVVRFTPSSFPPTLSTTYGSGTVIDSAHSTGVALDPATDDVFVNDGTYVAAYEPSGVPILSAGEPLEIGLGTLGAGYGVAVSGFPATAGQVYVADAADHTVKAYDPTTDPSSPVSVVEGAGTPQSGFSSLVDSDLAIDSTDGHLYVADNLLEPFDHPLAAVDEFNASGEYRGQLPPATISGKPAPLEDAGPSGLALDGASRVYVTNGNSDKGALYVYGPTKPSRRLQVSRTGTGAGTVTSKPGGINCPKACAAEYNRGETLVLTASPDSHSTFSRWSVDGSSESCPGKVLTCQVTLSADSEVSAEFTMLPQKTLTVAKEGPGTVTSSLEGIDCGATCEAEFGEGRKVILTAVPASVGSAFSGWSVEGAGAACAGTGPCEVTMVAAITVKANFEVVPLRTLSISRSGRGTVSSDPAGIQCATVCSAQYNQGTEVTLIATPAGGASFGGWSGGGCGSALTCTVTLAADTALSASFVLASAPQEEATLPPVIVAPGPPAASSQGPVSTPRLSLGRVNSGLRPGTVTLSVVAPGPGTLSASGGELRPAKAGVSGPGATTLGLALDSSGKKALEKAKGHKLKVKVTVAFTPSDGGAPTLATKAVTFKAKGASAKGTGAH